MPSLPLGNIRSRIVYAGTGVDGFNKDERWIWLWPTDIKISPDLAGGDYGASLPQREATARSMPCDPPCPISRGRIYGPADGPVAVCVGLRRGYTNGSAWASGEVLDAGVSSFKVQLEFCSFLSVNELYLPGRHIQEILQGPKSPLDHKHLHVCSLIPTLCLCVSRRTNSITLKLTAWL